MADFADIVKAIKNASESEKKALRKALGSEGGPAKVDPSQDYKKQAEDLGAYIKKMEALGNSTQAQVLKAQAIVEQKELEVRAAQQAIQLAEQFEPQLAKNLEIAIKNLEAAESTIAAFEKTASRIQENNAHAKAFGSTLVGAIAPFQKLNFTGTLFEIGQGFFSAKEGAKDFFKELTLGLIDSVVGGLFDMAMQLDSMESNIQRATGASKDFAQAMVNGSDAIAQYYVSTEEFEKSVVGLFGTMTEFSGLEKDLQIQLAETASILGKYGVSAEEMGQAFQFANKIMGQSASQAAATGREIAHMAMKIGVPVDQMMQDFNTMMPELAKLGPTASDSFKALAREAKKSGLEVQKILNLTNKFDTFEDAAEMTGKLNAALGGNFVNAMDMMTATDPIERFDMLKDSLDNAGLSFDEMSYYQRKFFAEQMGLDSVGDLALMMSGNMSGLKDEVNMTSSEYEDMAEKAAEQATLQEKFQGTLQQIMRDLIDSGFLEYIHEMFDEFRKSGGKDGVIADFVDTVKDIATVIRDMISSDLFKWMVENIDLVIYGFMTFKGIQMVSYVGSLAKGLKALGGGIMGAAGKLKGFAKGASDVAENVTKATDAAANLSDAGKEIVDSGAVDTVKDMAGGAKELAESTPEAAAGQQLLNVQTAETGVVAKIAWPEILALGGALLLMGAGVYLAAIGMAELVRAFEPFEAAEILSISLALLVFGVTLAGLAYIMFGALPGLAVAYPVILALGGAFLLMGIGVGIAAFGLSYLVDSFANLSADKILATSVAFLSLGASLWGLSLALNALGSPLAFLGLAVLTGVVLILTNAMEDLLTIIGTLDEGALKPLGAIFEAMGGADTKNIQTATEQFKEIAKVLKEDMADVGVITEMTEMLIELKNAGNVLSKMSTRQSSKERSVQMTITLDAAATDSLLNGKTAEGTANLALEAYGQK